MASETTSGAPTAADSLDRQPSAPHKMLLLLPADASQEVACKR